MSTQKSTTRTTPRGRAAEPEAKPKDAQPKDAKGKTAEEVTEHELTNLQAFACRIATDLILRGGQEADLEAVLRGISGHAHSRRFPREWLKEENLSTDIEKWKLPLMRHWPDVAETKKPEPWPKTASEKRLAVLRERLEDHFKEFRNSAQTSDLYLLNDILEIFSSSNHGPHSVAAESPLAEAFTYELDHDYTFVKVQSGHVKMVESYVTLLNQADPPAHSDAPAETAL